MFIAHSGKVTSGIIENSYLALLNALNDPFYDGIELDIWETKDHHYIINHDFVYNYNLIKKQNLFTLESFGLCSLDSILNIPTSKIIMIEIKDFNISIKSFLTYLSKYQNQNIYLMSFSKELMNNIINYHPTYKCGLINIFYNNNINYRDYDFICLLDHLLTQNQITYFHHYQIPIFSYGLTKSSKLDSSLNYIIDNYQRFVIQ